MSDFYMDINKENMEGQMILELWGRQCARSLGL